jgi:hypothetical protein
MAPFSGRWCSRHGVFFHAGCAVRNSVSNSCPVCGNPTSSAGGVIFVFTLILGVGLAAWSGVVAWEGTQAGQLASYPLESLGGLQAGQNVRVVGVISGPSSDHVIVGTWESNGKSGSWSFSSSDFELDADNHSVEVLVGSLGTNVFGSPHSVAGQSQWYQGGDEIAVAGTVGGSAGQLQVDAKAVATNSSGFAAAANSGAFYWWAGAGGALLAIAAVSFLWYHRCATQHASNLRGAPRDFYKGDPGPDLS